MKYPRKTATIARLATLITAGNDYLAAWARRHNPEVVVVPTTIDTALYRPLEARATDDPICVGWSGSVTTSKHLDALVPVLAELQRSHGVRLLVIGDDDYRIEGATVDALPWRLESEIEDLRRIDVGVMPLPQDDWARGKCGLKALQYMSLGIPTVMSPVGVNERIATGDAALLADEPAEWRRSLERLIEDPAERQALGARGRSRVEQDYSIEATLPLYADVMERMASTARSR
jgi:glycosyltransferase involved in cell wall biosynthesis